MKEKNENEEQLLSEENENQSEVFEEEEDEEELRIKKEDEEMRDSFKNLSKLVEKMKKNVESMGENKLMNYNILFTEFDTDVISFNKGEKKLLKLVDNLSKESNLPKNIKKNLEKVQTNYKNKKDIFEKLKNSVEDYKCKYLNDQEKNYNDMFNDNNRNDKGEGAQQQFIIKNNEQILEERKKVIEQVKQTSSEMVDTTKMIANTMLEQGEKINDIENNIINASENFTKGKKEIEIFKKTNEKKTRFKSWLLIFALIPALIIIYKLLL